MVWISRSFVISLFVYIPLVSHSKSLKNRSDGFFGFFHGYKIGYENYEIPAIIIMPFINQHQTVSIQKTHCDTKRVNQENEVNEKIVNELLSDKLVNLTTTDNETDDIEVVFKPAVKRDTQNKTNITNEAPDFERQATDLKEETTVIDEKATPKPDITTTKIDDTNETSETTSILNSSTTIMPGFYPYPDYNNNIAKNITFTTEAPMLPTPNEIWQNVSSIDQTRYYPVNTHINENPDHLSDFNENDVLPPQNDERWRQFSKVNHFKTSGEFKPLAGLYYDGFLHKPLKKYNFNPRGYFTLPN